MFETHSRFAERMGRENEIVSDSEARITKRILDFIIGNRLVGDEAMKTIILEYKDEIIHSHDTETRYGINEIYNPYTHIDRNIIRVGGIDVSYLLTK